MALLAYLFSQFIKDISPLKRDIRRYAQSPDYEGRVAFIRRFHQDFKKIVSAYAEDETVYVFVDDLDRCQVPKAADLMQALNLMIGNDPRIVFLIGMDREKVAAGLAVKHEKLLPYRVKRPCNAARVLAPKTRN